MGISLGEFKSCVQGAKNRDEVTTCIKDFDAVYGDIIGKLGETKQIYILSLDYPISVNRTLFKLLDDERKVRAKAKSVPEEQYEFEDLFGEWLGLV